MARLSVVKAEPGEFSSEVLPKVLRIQLEKSPSVSGPDAFALVSNSAIPPAHKTMAAKASAASTMQIVAVASDLLMK